MTRWLMASREGLGAPTKPTELTKPAVKGTGPEVLSVKSVLSGWLREEHGLCGEGLNDLLDAWEERAAIRQYDAGQTREEAEWAAARDVAGSKGCRIGLGGA